MTNGQPRFAAFRRDRHGLILRRYFASSEYLCRNSGLYTSFEPSTMNGMEHLV